MADTVLDRTARVPLIAAGELVRDAAKAIVLRKQVTLNAGHQYHRAGTPVLGVTEALRRVGIIDDRWWTEEHAERGTQIHALMARTLTPATPWIQHVSWWDQHIGSGWSFYRWLNEKQPLTLAAELLVYDPVSDVAGTLDWFGVLDDTLCVLDWKSGAEASWHALQTAAYTHALLAESRGYQQRVTPRIRRGALYLHENGSVATFRAHYKPSDAQIFQAALLVARFR